VFVRFRIFPQVDLEHQFGDGLGPFAGFAGFAGFAVQCDPTGVARRGSIPGVLSYATMADALSGTMTGARP
jgi:hypothetical protein